MHPGGCGHSPLLLLVGKPGHLHAQQHASQHTATDKITNKNLRHSACQQCVCPKGRGGGGGCTALDNDGGGCRTQSKCYDRKLENAALNLQHR